MLHRLRGRDLIVSEIPSRIVIGSCLIAKKGDFLTMLGQGPKLLKDSTNPKM